MGILKFNLFFNIYIIFKKIYIFKYIFKRGVVKFLTVGITGVEGCCKKLDTT